MTRKEFEDKYLNKFVVVEFPNGDYFKGKLFSTNDFMKQTNIPDMKNYYFVGKNIRENGLRFRKSHIKKIRLLSCYSYTESYELKDSVKE